MLEGERAKLLKMEDSLRARVVGQEDARGQEAGRGAGQVRHDQRRRVVCAPSEAERLLVLAARGSCEAAAAELKSNQKREEAARVHALAL